MVAREMAYQTDSNHRQKSETSDKDREHNIRNRTSENPEDVVTGSDVHRERAVEANTLFVCKVKDKESDAVEKKQNGSHQRREEGHKKPTGGEKEERGES